MFYGFWRLLSAQGCTRLKVLTPCIRLTSLETLDLRECSSLEFFPKVLEPMENVRDIYLDQTAIKELPFSIENLVGLERLYLRHCARLKQLPSSILMLPKLQVILEYGRRFQLFEGYETKKKVCSEVCLGLMMQYYTRVRSLNKRDLHFCRCLDAYSINTSPTNNFFQIFCVPMALPLFDLVSILKGRYRFNVSIDSLPLSFWFRKEFPKVVLCVIGEPVTGMDCSVLDIKLSVLTNGAEQLSCLWNYTFSTKGEMIKPVTWCGLRSQLNRVISDHEWNHVEVSWELKYHNPHDPHSQNSNPIGIPSRTIESTPIYVFEEENYIRENIRIENPDVSVSGSNNVNRQNTGMDELISLTKLELQDDNKECRNDL
ncbi:TMV resistance protein N-like [Senna tora]|uniref:TMV resistance protein N-like n=1 Tax=Senna tora TaxID=362788 RepID=A0A834T1W2_9FABA|nr:TMV resistance protein N-like [Senna tora]